jgi:hypothetical protein
MSHGSAENESAVTENPNRVNEIPHQCDVYTKDPACELSDL